MNIILTKTYTQNILTTVEQLHGFPESSLSTTTLFFVTQTSSHIACLQIHRISSRKEGCIPLLIVFTPLDQIYAILRHSLHRGMREKHLFF